jgi:hypothetical integral membrane protein (TIGR02206 family)
MLYFDFINPYIMYAFVVLLAAFTIYAIFNYKVFIDKHKKTIFIVVSILLIWTQLARYLGVLFKEGFIFTEHLPFYMCRLSVLVLLYYVLTKDKRVESFLFYWGATGLAGVIYPNGPIENIANLTETFYIDHFLLAMMPFFLVVYQGYKPSAKDLFAITGVMAVLLYIFIPINNLIGADYFYLNDQSIIGVIIPGLSSYIFATIHYLVALGYFSIFYFGFRNKNYIIE